MKGVSGDSDQYLQVGIVHVVFYEDRNSKVDNESRLPHY